MPLERTVKYLIILTSILLFSCSNSATDTITLIPDGYTGPVKISLCDGKGKEEKLENGKRIYEIDTNGLLITKFKAEFGWQFNKYYYVKDNNRQEIRFLNFYDKDVKFDKDSVYVFGEQHSGTGSKTDSTGTYQTCPIITFYVGKYKNVEKKMHDLTMFSFKTTELINEK
ncbi:hypothetical protein LS48_05365 [Aequorivita aquimaris]|jgi:hypothetical protein|uniref:DUF6843 domain-containing protein n=1 Tax=Aequorivita aquimaris TaxID=1548749 RepID=A0A137RIA2_9FLAO|nr:hypothetical protein [Aequorivita aquimaris]KXN99911.1 hypothetical protein LS48_05365 [Aequorivita aquimaris]